MIGTTAQVCNEAYTARKCGFNVTRVDLLTFQCQAEANKHLVWLSGNIE
jgi:hypothetical protein